MASATGAASLSEEEEEEPVLLNGEANKERVELPKVIVENAEDSSRFASSVLKVLSMQRFYSKSRRKPRDTWLEKYTYRRAADEWDWRRPLMRMSPSPTSLPTSPASEKPGTPNDAEDFEVEPSDLPRTCCFPFILDPSGRCYFLWLMTVSLGVIYNYWAIILYLAFPPLLTQSLKTCIVIDYTFDSIFLLDVLVQFRTGFIEEGVMEVRCLKLAKHYACSYGFLLDLISILPFDALYFYLGVKPILRFNRLFKLHRFLLFCDRGEIYSGRPKLFNLFKLIHYLFLIIHWVACVYFILSRYEGFGTDEWLHPKLENELSSLGMQYLYSLYRSSVSMTTVGAGVIGTIATPRTILTLFFVIVTYLTGVLIFATIVGNAGDMIVDMRRSRERYLRKINGMKEYIEAHQLPAHIKKRVIQWFDYLWTHKRDMDEQELFHKLNDNFKAEIAIHVNLETLIRVEMFHDCDPGFLHELVLKLRPVICSPGDFICRQGEKGREMYIVNKGTLEVLDEKETVLAALSAGSHFGEISLLNMKGIGNCRTASVRSLGFSDLFQLSKTDLEEVLEFYPEQKANMENIAMKTYEKQRRERLGQLAGSENEDNGVEETFLKESDPRKWLAADTKTLRRRLSTIESINNLRKFASKVRREQETAEPPQECARDVLKRFAEKAREKRTDSESKRIVDEFVAGIREREKEELETSCATVASSFESAWRTSDVRARLMQLRKKRHSYSASDEAETSDPLDSDGSLSPLSRPRSLTGPRKQPTPYKFQTLAVPQRLSLAKLSSLGINGGVKAKTVETYKQSTEPTSETKRQLKASKPSSFLGPSSIPPSSTPPSYRLRDNTASRLCEEKQRQKMERKRRWFEAAIKATGDSGKDGMVEEARNELQKQNSNNEGRNLQGQNTGDGNVSHVSKNDANGIERATHNHGNLETMETTGQAQNVGSLINNNSSSNSETESSISGQIIQDSKAIGNPNTNDATTMHGDDQKLNAEGKECKPLDDESIQSGFSDTAAKNKDHHKDNVSSPKRNFERDGRKGFTSPGKRIPSPIASRRGKPDSNQNILKDDCKGPKLSFEKSKNKHGTSALVNDMHCACSCSLPPSSTDDFQCACSVPVGPPGQIQQDDVVDIEDEAASALNATANASAPNIEVIQTETVC